MGGAGDKVVVVLVGNKFDLTEQDPSARKVDFNEAQNFARQHGLLFSESSAVSSYNVNHIFTNLLQEVYLQSDAVKGASTGMGVMQLGMKSSGSQSQGCD